MSEFLKALRHELERRHGGHPDDLMKPFKDRTEATFDLSPQEQEIMALRTKLRHQEDFNDRLRQENNFLQGRVKTQEIQINGLRHQLHEAEAIVHTALNKVVPTWVKKFLPFLIFACHPDRNQGREKEADEVTKRLLELRK